MTDAGESKLWWLRIQAVILRGGKVRDLGESTAHHAPHRTSWCGDPEPFCLSGDAAITCWCCEKECALRAMARQPIFDWMSRRYTLRWAKLMRLSYRRASMAVRWICLKCMSDRGKLPRRIGHLAITRAAAREAMRVRHVARCSRRIALLQKWIRNARQRKPLQEFKRCRDLRRRIGRALRQGDHEVLRSLQAECDQLLSSPG